ncbi:MAG: fluoride efflux transporter CrcB [Flavobacteriaceae bacterium]|nr:fluoride efflux transporter CrcB [Flavobacteriaceae bacterium]
MKFILVFLGGGLGSALRYLVSKHLNNLEKTIPYGTFLVNILGSLLIGIVIALSLKNNSILSQNQTLLLATGFCGGFTTFAAFAFENTQFLKNGDYLPFFAYTFGTLIIGVAAVFLGLFLAK